MGNRWRWIAMMLAVLIAGCASQDGSLGVATETPPRPPREFRGAWVASVGNIDWPSSPGAPVSEQLDQMRVILDKAVELKLNALIIQVRPGGDALYPSALEPWSGYLTGAEGRPPEPLYDPLATWITEAHKRGIEIHAWFNPYRARHNQAKWAHSPSHISVRRPDLVRKFNGWEWLDPAEPEVRQHTVSVVLDVVRRYDVDGIHIDDYFYPYAEYLGGKDFPDDGAWQKYQRTGGKLARADWRRDNVNTLIRELYQGIKSNKPWVKFGISPFGIWRPNNPPGIKGLDSYERLYADSRLWLNQGWCDYVSPQLYWQASSAGQPYAPLLKWWVEQNAHGRHIWPGLHTSNVNKPSNPWPSGEIVQQVFLTRQQNGAGGNVHFSMRTLTGNANGVADLLKTQAYTSAALMPASPWLGGNAPAAPDVGATAGADGSIRIAWRSSDSNEPFVWAAWVRAGGKWTFGVYPQGIHELKLPRGNVDRVGIMAVNRLGQTSAVRMVQIGG